MAWNNPKTPLGMAAWLAFDISEGFAKWVLRIITEALARLIILVIYVVFSPWIIAFLLSLGILYLCEVVGKWTMREKPIWVTRQP